jgi:hypothetical protein
MNDLEGFLWGGNGQAGVGHARPCGGGGGQHSTGKTIKKNEVII